MEAGLALRLGTVVLWLLMLVAVAAAARFVQTALAAPERAGADDAYHTDFRRLKIVYYVATWIGCGAVVFFATDGILAALPAAAGFARFPLFDQTTTLVAVALGFLSIFVVDRVSVAREVLTEANRRDAEAETFRRHLRDLVAGLNYDETADPNDIRTLFLRRAVDLELAANGLTPGDRELARSLLRVAERGTRAMDGVMAPPPPLFGRH
jgi:hypothetical protein